MPETAEEKNLRLTPILLTIRYLPSKEEISWLNISANNCRIESWGRGIQRIFEACRAGGAPEPEISLSGHDLWTEFPYSPEYLEAIGEGSETRLGEKVGEKVGEKLSENRQKILESIQLNPKVSQKKLAETLGIATKNIETNITYLKKHGYLKRVGPAKGGHWELLT